MGNFDVGEYIKSKRNKTKENEDKNKKVSNQTEGFDVGKYIAQKRYNTSVKFDTLETDINTLAKDIEKVYGGWQTEETLNNTRSSIEAMQTRVKAYQEYLNKYGDDKTPDLADLLKGYDTVLSGLDNFKTEYGKYKDADEYNYYMSYDVKEKSTQLGKLTTVYNGLKEEADTDYDTLVKQKDDLYKSTYENYIKNYANGSTLPPDTTKPGQMLTLPDLDERSKQQNRNIEQEARNAANEAVKSLSTRIAKIERARELIDESGDNRTAEEIKAEMDKLGKEISDVYKVRYGIVADEDSWFKGGGFSDGVSSVLDFFGDLGETIVGTVADTTLNLVQGGLSLVEGIVDLGTYGVAGVADLVGADGASEDIKNFGKKNLVHEGRQAIDDATGDWINENSVLGTHADAVTEGVGQIGTIVLTGGLGAAGGLGAMGTTALTTGVTFASSTGSGMSEAYNAGATDGEAFTYGITKGAIDAGTELLFGGMGKATKAIGIGKSGIPLDDVLAKAATSGITNRTVKNLAQYGIKSSAEGLEEVIAGYLTAHAKKGTYMSERDFGDILEDENLLEQFIVGTVSSAIAQSGYVPGMKNGSVREANRTGRDFITGYTNSEQIAIDKEIKNRVAEIEQNGEKITNKKIGEITKQVQQDFEQGKISFEKDYFEGRQSTSKRAAKKTGAKIRENNQIDGMLGIASLSQTETDAYNLYTEYAQKGINADNISDSQLGELHNKVSDDAKSVLGSPVATTEQIDNAKKTLDALAVYSQEKPTQNPKIKEIQETYDDEET